MNPLVARTVALKHILGLRYTLLIRLSADTVQNDILLLAIPHYTIEENFWYGILRFCWAVDILVRVNTVQRETRSSKVSKFNWIHFFWHYSLDFFRRTHVTIRFRCDCRLKCTLDQASNFFLSLLCKFTRLLRWLTKKSKHGWEVSAGSRSNPNQLRACTLLKVLLAGREAVYLPPITWKAGRTRSEARAGF